MPCSSCGREKVLARGLCQPCYHRLRRRGTVERKYVVRQDTCAVAGCGAESFAKNLCTFHYNKAQHPLKTTWKLLRSRYAGQYPEAWDRFESFCADVGARPSPAHQLRRKRNSEAWSAGNIQWVSRIGSTANRLDPNYARDWTLQSKYKLSREQHAAILKKQGGRCAICGCDKAHPKTDRRIALHVDHCHETKVVRGLLCAGCNRGLGYFNDDPKLLNKAIAYLQRAKKSAA